MPKFKVKAHVYVVAEAEITVEAADHTKALQVARVRFEADKDLRRHCVLNNSADTSHPFDFEPLEAVPVS